MMALFTEVFTDMEAAKTLKDLGIPYHFGVMSNSGKVIATPGRADAPALIKLLKEEGYKAAYAS